MGFAYVLETFDCPEQLSSTHPGFLYSGIEHSYTCGTFYMPFILISQSYSTSGTLNKNKPVFLRTKCCPAVPCARVWLQSRGYVLSYEGWTVQLTLWLCFPVSRLEERESEMKKEYNALHQRHTEVVRMGSLLGWERVLTAAAALSIYYWSLVPSSNAFIVW